jgi:periplasmic divalent cation tolerance protein
MTDVVLILSTVPEDFDADRLAHALVDARHAACVTIGPPMRSTYRWHDGVEAAAERQVLIKTTTDRVSGLEAALTAAHPYEVPEFLVLPVTGGSTAYLAWARESVRLSP